MPLMYLTLCQTLNPHAGKICNNDFASVIAEHSGVMLLHVHIFMQQMVINIDPLLPHIFILTFEGGHFSM